MPKVIVMANDKGGACRTTTAVNLAHELAEAGEDVLYADFDPDICGTEGLGFDPANMTTILDVLIEPKLGFAPRAQKKGPVVPYAGYGDKRISYPGRFDVLVGSREIMSAPDRFDGSLSSQPKEVQIFEKVVWYLIREFCNEYSYVILDPTSLHGRLAQALLGAAQYALVPMQMEAMYKRGVLNLFATLKEANDSRNKYDLVGAIILLGLLGCKVQSAEEQSARMFFAGLPRNIPFFDTIVPYTLEGHDAPDACVPIAVYAPGNAAAVGYERVAQEVVKRVR